MRVSTVLATGMALCAFEAAAASLEDIDYGKLTFTRATLVDAGSGANDTSTGSSNGIEYELTGGIYEPYSKSQTFNDLQLDNQLFDDLHLGSVFKITFAQPVTHVLIALANDNLPGVMGIDFGLPASDTTGTVTQQETDYRIQDIDGALILYEFDPAITELTQQIPGTGDGFDMVFFANPIPAETDYNGPSIGAPD